MMKDERYYADINALSEFASVKDADLQLHQGNGWELIRMEKLTNDSVTPQGIVRSERLVFILGRRSAGGNGPTTRSQAQTPTNPSQEREATGQPSGPSQPAPPAKPKMTGMSSPCKYCQGPIWWVKEGGKNVPKNEDGERHSCR